MPFYLPLGREYWLELLGQVVPQKIPIYASTLTHCLLTLVVLAFER